jgi:hypothetical protein
MGQEARMEDSTNPYNISVSKSEGKTRLGRSRRGSKDNIKIDIKELGYAGGDLIHPAPDENL